MTIGQPIFSIRDSRQATVLLTYSLHSYGFFPLHTVILRFLEVLSARRVTSWKKSVSLEHEWLAGEPGSHSASS